MNAHSLLRVIAAVLPAALPAALRAVPQVVPHIVPYALLVAVLLVAAPARAADAVSRPPSPAASAALLELGRHLFFESRLSGDGSRSCASCHAPAHGFSEGVALSRGYNHTGHFRNAPGLLGLRLKERLGWDGRYRIDELPKLVEEMLTSPITMNGNPGIVAERVRQVPQLLQLWQLAFGERTPPSFEGVARAIAAWSAAHDGGDTPVDAALRGDVSALSPRAAEGLRLFTGKAACSHCHSGPAFSDGLAHRLGVPESPQILRDPERTVALLAHHASHGSADPMSERSDTGVHALTRRAADRGRFFTPGLRGVAQTAPYMHNGTLPDLAAVVAFYDRGGGRGSETKPLGLSAGEREALVAFLEALTPRAALAGAPPPAFDYATQAGAGR